MGLEYHNEVKNSFHLKIINIRKKIFCSSEIWTPVPWTKCQSLTHITSQPVGVFFSKIFDVFMQCKLFIAGDSKFWKLSSFKLVFENFWMTKKSKNDEIVFRISKVKSGSNAIKIRKPFLLTDSYLQCLINSVFLWHVRVLTKVQCNWILGHLRSFQP